MLPLLKKKRDLDIDIIKNVLNFETELFETMVNLSRPKSFARFYTITYWSLHPFQSSVLQIDISKCHSCAEAVAP